MKTNTQMEGNDFGNVVCIRCDNNGIVSSVSSNLHALVGINSDDIKGKDILSFLTPELARKVILVAIRSKKNNSSEGFSFTWQSSNGSKSNISLNICYNDDQGFNGVLMPFHPLQAENEKRRKQHDVFRSIMESIDDNVFILDRNGRFFEFPDKDSDPGFANLNSSFKPGIHLSEAGFPDDVEKLFCDAIKKIVSDKSSAEIRYELDAFGSKLYYQARLSPNFNHENEVESVTVVSRDISSLVKTEQKQKKLLDYYLTVFDNFPTLIWRANKNKEIDYLNKTLQNFTGRALEQDRGDGWQDAIHPEDKNRVLFDYYRKFDLKKPFIQEYRMIHNSGTYRWVKVFLVPLCDYKGRFSGYMGNCIDIDDIRRTQKLLQESELRYRELFDNVPDIVFSLDGNGKIRKINKAAAKILGFDNIKLENKNALSFFIPKEKRSVYRQFERVVKEFKKSFSFETKVLDNYEKVKSLQIKGFVNYNSENSVSEVFGIARDITMQKTFEKSIYKNTIITEERERKRLAEELHDGIGPLLSGLKMYLQQESLNKNLDHRQNKTLVYCRSLVDDAITQTRSISNNLTPGILNDFGLQKALESHVSKINAIGKFRVNLRIKFTAEDIDEETSLALYRVVCELLNNSLKHSGCNVVEIVMDIRDHVLSASYSDDGKGFDYIKLTQNNAGKMGLSNMQNRINSLNGNISIYSAEGMGIFVKIFLPLKKLTE